MENKGSSVPSNWGLPKPVKLPPILLRVLRNYYETYNDEKTFPRSEYPELWEELNEIKNILEVK